MSSLLTDEGLLLKPFPQREPYAWVTAYERPDMLSEHILAPGGRYSHDDSWTLWEIQMLTDAAFDWFGLSGIPQGSILKSRRRVPKDTGCHYGSQPLLRSFAGTPDDPTWVGLTLNEWDEGVRILQRSI